jgi:glycine cleavage system transcriptional repressor
MTDGAAHLVLSVLGTDRPGLVDEISQFILDRGGNIEESRMSVLGGEFGAMLLIGGPEPAIAAIESDIQTLTATAPLRLMAKRTAAPASHTHAGALAYRLTATTLDHPGIVKQVSGLLAEHGVNIVRAECSARPGPWSGAPVFHLEMTLAVPTQGDVGSLREALKHLGADEGIDIELHAAGG